MYRTINGQRIEDDPCSKHKTANQCCLTLVQRRRRWTYGKPTTQTAGDAAHWHRATETKPHTSVIVLPTSEARTPPILLGSFKKIFLISRTALSDSLQERTRWYVVVGYKFSPHSNLFFSIRTKTKFHPNKQLEEILDAFCRYLLNNLFFFQPPPPLTYHLDRPLRWFNAPNPQKHACVENS